MDPCWKLKIDPPSLLPNSPPVPADDPKRELPAFPKREEELLLFPKSDEGCLGGSALKPLLLNRLGDL